MRGLFMLAAIGTVAHVLLCILWWCLPKTGKVAVYRLHRRRVKQRLARYTKRH